MENHASPKLLDVTVRDGSYLINHQFTPAMVADLAKGLRAAGVQWAEISHGMGLGGKMMGYPAQVDDEDLLAAAKEAAPDLKISLFLSPVDLTLPIIPGVVDYFELGRIAVHVEETSIADKFVKKLKKYQKQVSIQLVRCHSRPPEEAAAAAKLAESMGADVVYVVDTYGSMRPHEVKEYLAAVQAETKIPTGFHGHNTTGLAVPNTLAALEQGATWIDASLMGVGRGAGNAPLEQLAYHLARKNYGTPPNSDVLFKVIDETVLPIFKIPPSSHYIDLLFSQDRLDFSPSSFVELCAHAVNTDVEDFLLQLQNKMGTASYLSEAHLKETVTGYGVDYTKLIEVLRE